MFRVSGRILSLFILLLPVCPSAQRLPSSQELAASFNSTSDLSKLAPYRIEAVISVKGVQEATGTLIIYHNHENARQELEFTDYHQIEVTSASSYYVWRRPDMVLEFADLLVGLDELWQISPAKDVEPSSVSRADVHGDSALCFKLRADKDLEVRNCFDATNHLLINRETKSAWSTQEIQFLDYQEVDGIHLPSAIRFIRPHAPEIEIRKITLIKMPLEAAVFAPPSGARKFSFCKNAKPPQVTHTVEPAYPQMARIAHITGDVRMVATIGEDGKLRDFHAVAGHPILVQAALEAVKQWTYTPEMCPSGPEAKETTIKISFRM